MNQEKLSDYLAGWNDCKRCNLCNTMRKGLVFGEGDPNSKIMFIGEWPKNQMNESQGKCMLDKELTLFYDALDYFGTSAKDVFITPMLSCRPVDDMGTTTKPQVKNIKICAERVEEMIDIIDPLVLVLIGQQAFNRFGKNEHNKYTYANLTSDPKPFESVTIGKSGAEIRRSSVVIRPLEWTIEKETGKSGGPAHKMLMSLQMAFAILDNYNHYMHGIERPARKEVIDL